jgi:hypothetical protein
MKSLKSTLSHASEKLKTQIDDLSDVVREQATTFGDAMREKAISIIEDWLKIFPVLESYGLKVSSFGVKMGLNPMLDVELLGNARQFTPEILQKIIEENKHSATLTTVFKTIKTTYEWYTRTSKDIYFKSIIIKLSISITPEVKVYLGEPRLN